jgi:hypothetical protein
MGLVPPRSSSLCSHLRALRLRHGLKTALAADLSTLAAYCCHILRQVRGRRWGLASLRIGLWCLPLACRLLHNPLRKLVGITRTFAFADGHESIMPYARNGLTQLSVTRFTDGSRRWPRQGS